MEFHKIKLPKDTHNCAVCGDHPTNLEPIDYEQEVCEETAGRFDAPVSYTHLGTVSVLLRGIPFIYQGQEIGMQNAKWNSIDEYDDILSPTSPGILSGSRHCSKRCNTSST